MRKSIPTLRMLTGFAVLCCTVLIAWFLSGLGSTLAQAPPPPPPDTPTPGPTFTDTPIPSSTPTASNTPTPTGSATPTSTARPTHTATSTRTPTPTHTPTSAQPPTEPENPKEPKATAKPAPDCQSVVEGKVISASEQPGIGATVNIKGEGWSNAMLTDDNGHYGFGGLCAGAVSLTAYLANGQISQSAQVSLNGKDKVQVDLSASSAGAAIITDTPPAQQTPTPEPEMPVTGHSGWLLVGAALLGALLLITAGARRALSVQQRTRDRE